VYGGSYIINKTMSNKIHKLSWSWHVVQYVEVGFDVATSVHQKAP